MPGSYCRVARHSTTLARRIKPMPCQLPSSNQEKTIRSSYTVDETMESEVEALCHCNGIIRYLLN